ncbi:MAG: DUF4349 domain-containing protein [Oscillospiraceae bacterium]|nr:DUF4349 domain-containing protein [Oscillospiraceae bacterium]
MKKSRVFALGLALIMALLLLAGCSKSVGRMEAIEAPAMMDHARSYDAYEEEAAIAEGVYYGNAVKATSGYWSTTNQTTAPGDGGSLASSITDRYVIANARLELQTKQYEKLNLDIQVKLDELKGYVESSNEYNYDHGRYESLTVRVPSDQLDAFMSGLEDNATVISKDVSYTDVTNEMIETGSRKKALETEETALLAILAKAETVEDIIRVQDRLSNVRSELESYALKLQRLNNQVNYSTVYMSIREVERISAPSQTFRALAESGFVNSLKEIARGFRSFAIWVIGSIPYFVLIVVICVPVVALIVRKIRKRRKAKNS